MISVLMVALGGAVGALVRYLTDRFVQARHDSIFPWGTHAVNATACLFFGFIAVLSLPQWLFSLVAIGFLGALSTYSTFAYETLRLAQRKARFLAFANAAASVGAGLGAAMIGAAFAAALT
jgi:fluoride exporter